jgi:multisubunit Na+/H+ antiporter MnhB subunit
VIRPSIIARDPSRRSDWLTTIRHYLLASVVGHLVWEMAQMPLYTVWQTGTTRDIATALVHCTLGDMSIALVTLSLALVVIGSPGWPMQQFAAVSATVVVLSVGYTIYSEYVNTIVRRNWAYGALMPTLPWIGTGLSPLLQWMVVPSLAFVWSGRNRSHALPPR